MQIIYTLLSYFEYIFWFILVFTIIVFIHEFGHFYIAKLNKVEVEKFSIGFGPVLYSRTDKFNTKWQIGMFPLGGYVKFLGEMYPDKKEKKYNVNKNLFMNKGALQKASIVLAGPLANFLFSFLLFIFIFFFFGKNSTSNQVGSLDLNSPAERSNLKIYDKIISINDKQIRKFEEIYQFLDNEKVNSTLSLKIERNNKLLQLNILPDIKVIKTYIGTERTISYLGINPIINPTIGKVLKNSPAKSAGLLKNDKIIKIDDVNILDALQIIEIVNNNLNKELEFTVLRKSKNLVINIIPKDLSNKNLGQIGITFKKSREKLNFLGSILESIFSIYEVSAKTLIAFWEILFGKRDHCEVGGPILIAKVSNDVANTDLISFLALIALISINLGLINLFPLPLLDGGHFITYLSEFLVGKNINYNIFKVVQVIGVALIFSFMTFSIINDVYCRVLN